MNALSGFGMQQQGRFWHGTARRRHTYIGGRLIFGRVRVDRALYRRLKERSESGGSNYFFLKKMVE